MKKCLLSFMTLTMLTMSNAFATQVEVTMNAKSKLIKSLVNMTTNESVTVGEPASNKYTFDAPDGSYLLTATAADGETVSGTIQLDIDADHTAFSIFSSEVRVKNTDWVYGTDYTFDLKVSTKEGADVNTTMGDYTSGNKMFLVFSGNTYYLDVIPTEARQAEGYVTASYSGTVTFNPTIQAEVPMSVMYSITVPAGANLFVGTKTAHFVKFKGVAPESVEGGTVYTFKLADKQQYNYRVSKEGKLTQAGIFTMSTDETKRPELVFTDADMEAKSPKFVDHNVASNDGYNVGDILLNINPAGHLKLANVGDTYDILPMRNWELTNTATANYFIEPDFHFTVVNLNGQEDNSVVKVEDELLTAVGTGTALVLVTYDAIHLDFYNNSATSSSFVGGNDWGAIWPENTGVFVVTVGEETTGITPNMTINQNYLTQANGVDTKMSMENVDAEFDVLYYLDTEEGFDYTFTPEGVSSVTLARPVLGENAASYTGFSAEGVTANADGSYTVRLTEGRNIVCLTGADGKSLYQVITAKPCHRDIMVGDEVVTSVKPGDAVTVQYSGLYHPANKLAGIHNFNAFLDYKQASEGIAVTKGKANQYKFASTPTAQAVTFTVPEDWTEATVDLTDGVIGIGNWGDPIGNHRFTSKEKGRAPNFTAIQQSAVFGRVPALELPVYIPNPDIATLEDTGVEFNEEGFWNGGKIGTPEVGDWDEDTYHCTWTSGRVTGHVDYSVMEDLGYDWWGGIALSQRTGTELKSLDDQYNNIVGTGANGSKTFGVIYGDQFSLDINVEGGAVVKSMYVVNSAYTMQNVLVGDGYSPKFQDEGDHLYLNITATKADGTAKTKVVKLAEWTDKLEYISEWTKVDLRSFGNDVTKLTFTFDAHNSGVPLYACIDDIEVAIPVAPAVATFEDIALETESFSKGVSGYSTLTSGDYQFDVYCDDSWGAPYYYAFCAANYTGNTYEDDYNGLKNIVGGGYDGSDNYGTFFTNFYGQNSVTVLQNGVAVVPGFYITNSSYAYSSMMNGDGIAKKFDKGDWFKLTITGYDADGEVTGTKEYYLADLRDANTAYIVNDWRYVDLSCLGAVSKLGFELSSTDNDPSWGMNTPAYFCFDNFGAKGTEVLPEKNVEISTGISLTPALSEGEGAIYNLAGQRLSNVRRGINIVGGKKILR